MITVAQVEEWLSLPTGGGGPLLDGCVSAAEEYVARRVDPSWHGLVSLEDPWPATLQLGCVMLAGRLYQRHYSPEGLMAQGDYGPITVVSVDPDVERLLGIGRHQGPVVA